MELNHFQRCKTCGHLWSPRQKGFTSCCPQCKGAVATGPTQVLLSLDDDPPTTPSPSGPTRRRRLFWTAMLILSIGVIIALNGAAVAIIASLFQDDREKPEAVVATGNPVDRTTEKKPERPKRSTAKPTNPPEMPGENDEPDRVEVAPEPRIVPDLQPAAIETAPEPRWAGFIAPMPRRANRLPFPASPGWSSEWDRNGDVRVRIRAVKITPLPTVNTDRSAKPTDSVRRLYTSEPAFVIWLEIQNASPDRPRNLRRWQPVTSGECTLYYPLGYPVGLVNFPVKQGFEWVEDYERVLAPGADPLTEAVFFRIPEDQPSHLTLKLAAKHVGEKYAFTFDIPAKAWAK